MASKKERCQYKGLASLVCLLLALAPFSAECATSGTQGQTPQVTCDPETGESVGNVTVTSVGKNFVLFCGIGGVKSTVPYKFDGTKVCTSEAIKRDFLSAPEDCEELADFSSLFPGVAGVSGWWRGKTVSTSKKSWELAIPKQNFPRYNQRFWVGCSNVLATGEKHCMVAVAVEGVRASQEKNKVTCSYTKNESLAVTLSPAEPEFTLDCGVGAVPVPSNLNSAYCSGPITSKACETKSYGGVLPGYPSEGLWTGDITKGGAAVFKIRPGTFPSTKATFNVGCAGPVGTPGENNFCTVAVTLDPASSGSGNPGGAGGGNPGGPVSGRSARSDSTGTKKSDGNWAAPRATVWIVASLVAVVLGAHGRL